MGRHSRDVRQLTVHPSYVMMKRSEIREKFGIDGDGMSDCCVTYWVRLSRILSLNPPARHLVPITTWARESAFACDRQRLTS